MLVVAAGALAGASAAATPLEPLRLAPVAILEQPVDLATRAGDPNLYIAERTGRVQTIGPAGVAATPFLDLSDRVSLAGELGLLGIVFSPEGDRLYVNYTGGGLRSRLHSWAIVGGVLDPASEREHLVIDDPASFHNGGQIAFGSDGFLYWSFGDGGQKPNAQNVNTLRGSILRIQPTPGGPAPYVVPADNPFVAGGAPEVWAYDLRNPWRFSFDRVSGDLWVADVGELQREEINRVKTGTPAGVNFGWPALEGNVVHTTPLPAGALAPVYDYARDVGTSVVGGFVYRGSALKSLCGQYVYGDFGKGFVAALGFDAAGHAVSRLLPLEVPGIVAFGQDRAGELYTLAIAGQISKIVPDGGGLPAGSCGATPEPPAPPKTPPNKGSKGPDPARLVGIKKAQLAANGRVLRLRLGCGKGASGSCRGRATVEATLRPPAKGRLAKGRRLKLPVTFLRFKALAAGKKRLFRLRLHKEAREALAANALPRRLRLTIVVRARDEAGMRRTTTVVRRVAVPRG